MKSEPNQALSTTTMAVTDCADAHSAPATVVADLGRSAPIYSRHARNPLYHNSMTTTQESQKSHSKLWLIIACAVIIGVGIFIAKDWKSFKDGFNQGYAYASKK
jgi:hypothetical protein